MDNTRTDHLKEQCSSYGSNGQPPPTQTPFMMMVSREYDNLIKNFFNTSVNRNLSIQDNEDIFHDTIIKCNKIVTDKNITSEDQMKSYLFHSLKTNGYREAEYSRNKNNSHTDLNKIHISSGGVDEVDNNIDLNIIYRYIEDNYGSEMLSIIKDHLHGYSIREIEKKYNKEGLNYKIRKIIKKIRSNKSMYDR